MEIKFKSTDIYIVAGIIRKVGLVGVMTSIKDLSNITNEEQGEMLNTLFGCLGNAQHEIDKLIKSVAGNQDLRNMDFKEYAKLQGEIFNHEDFNELFMAAFNLVQTLRIA